MTHCLKDWPTDNDFKTILKNCYLDFIRCLPIPDYTTPSGPLNLASSMPPEYVPSDLGPKMYCAFASHDSLGTTNLHMDMADAVNIMMYRSNTSTKHYGAIWDIYSPGAAQALRFYLFDHAAKNGISVDDPIHDQSFYLNETMRQELFDKYAIKSWRIFQNIGDTIVVPAGCAHQVCNVEDCIKVAMDFVSPENVDVCCELTEQFRRLSGSHKRRKDILQIKMILFHVFKSVLTTLNNSNKHE